MGHAGLSSNLHKTPCAHHCFLTSGRQKRPSAPLKGKGCVITNIVYLWIYPTKLHQVLWHVVHSVKYHVAIKNKLRSKKKKKNAPIQKGIHTEWSHLFFVFTKKGVKKKCFSKDCWGITLLGKRLMGTLHSWADTTCQLTDLSLTRTGVTRHNVKCKATPRQMLRPTELSAMTELVFICAVHYGSH